MSEEGKSYLYFFSYWGRGQLEEDDQGFGNCVLVLPSRLDDHFEIRAVEEHLRGVLHLPAVVLINFRFMRTVRPSEIVGAKEAAILEVARELFRRPDDNDEPEP